LPPQRHITCPFETRLFNGFLFPLRQYLKFFLTICLPRVGKGRIEVCGVSIEVGRSAGQTQRAKSQEVPFKRDLI
jgi:hypothetical protein